MGFFEPLVMAPHHNFVVIAPMIMKFDTGVKLDELYAKVTKQFLVLARITLPEPFPNEFFHPIGFLLVTKQ